MQFCRKVGNCLKSQNLRNLPSVSYQKIRKSSDFVHLRREKKFSSFSLFVKNVIKTSAADSYKFSTATTEEPVDSNTFEKVCEETLESLTEFFEELIESEDRFAAADISYSSGVLTVNLGKYGTYVINRQSPNMQIWLSSPSSGPKRYDYVVAEGSWIYKHDTRTLHELLEEELGAILGTKLNLSTCLHAKAKLS